MTDNLTSQARDYLNRISAYRPAQLMRRDLLAEDTELRRLLGEALDQLDHHRELLSTAANLISRFSAHIYESGPGISELGNYLEGGSSS